MQATVITFEVKRFAPGATSLRDIDAFIAEHENEKNDLVVQIDRAGIGDAFAEYLESNGFTVTCAHA